MIIRKKYIDKNGNERNYEYEYDYKTLRNKEIYKLQRQKWYYKKTGQTEKVKTIDLLIQIEKRRQKIQNKNEGGI